MVIGSEAYYRRVTESGKIMDSLNTVHKLWDGAFTEHHYTILYYTYDNMMFDVYRGFHKTKLLWDLNLTPNFYRVLADTVDELCNYGYLCYERRKPNGTNRVCNVYYLTESGVRLCLVLRGVTKKVTNT